MISVKNAMRKLRGHKTRRAHDRAPIKLQFEKHYLHPTKGWRKGDMPRAFREARGAR